MSLSMSQASVPAITQMLTSLSAVIDKAAEYCRSKGIAPSDVTGAQLAPDMFPFSRQVQLATDHAKGITARLSGRDNPKYEDTESTFEELKARIAKTLAFVKSVPASEIDGSETREVTLTLGGQPRSFTGQRYLFHFGLPNFYFHVTTAYDILRHKGVEIGKRDFIGAPPQA
jgi:uncharacterized protein